MGRCRNDSLLWAWIFIAAAADQGNTSLPPLAPNVLPSRELQVEPLTVADGAAPTPLARPTQRRWYFGYIR